MILLKILMFYIMANIGFFLLFYKTFKKTFEIENPPEDVKQAMLILMPFVLIPVMIYVIFTK